MPSTVALRSPYGPFAVLHWPFTTPVRGVYLVFSEHFGAAACELTTRGTPLGATTGRSQAAASKSERDGVLHLPSLSTASELAGLVCPQGCVPTKSALSPAGGPVASSGQADTSSREDHEFPNPSTLPAAERKQRRRRAYALRDGLRPLSSRRCKACGRKRIADEVEVVRRQASTPGGGTCQRAFYRGVMRCGSVWECPVCALQIRTERAEELKQAVERWGSSVAMMSLTVRHGLGDDLRAVRRGVSRAFSRLLNGAPWKRFCAKYGIDHHVRALELTHGANGWHPHLHVLFFLQVQLGSDERQEAIEWLQTRWAECVRRELGEAFLPNEHSVDLRDAKRADYLAKMSLELANPGTKRGRGKNRSPLEIAISAASGKNADDEALWVAYCAGMRGAKMLAWSKGLRDFLELGTEQSDEQVIEGEEQGEAEVVACITASAWDSARDRPGLPCAILEAAELAVGQAEGYAAIQDLIRSPRGRAPPPDEGSP